MICSIAVIFVPFNFITELVVCIWGRKENVRGHDGNDTQVINSAHELDNLNMVI